MNYSKLIYTINMSKNPAGYWTKDRCLEISKTCNNRSEFSYNFPRAYQLCCKNNWNEAFEHMIWKCKPNGFWNKENCHIVAKKYNSRYEFSLNDESAYKKAIIENWLDDICSHMREGKKPNGFWTKDECLKESKKYKTRKEFKEKSKFAYNKCHKNNWNDAFEHMIELGNLYNRCGYKMLFHDKNNKYIYIGLTFNYQLRIEQHLYDKSDNVYKFINKNELIFDNSYMYHDYIDVKESQKIEIEEIKKYKNDIEFIIINISNGGGIGGKKISIWTYETCKNCAKSCKTLGEFIKKYQVAYHTCRKHGWEDILNSLERKRTIK